MENSSVIEVGLPIALMIIMAGMGVTLTLGDFRNVFVYPKAMLVGSVAQILAIPLLAFGVIEIMNLSPAIAVGLVVIAACPGGATSNVFTFLAKGNVALSIVLTVIASLVTIFSIPVFTNLALDLYADITVQNEIRLPFLRTVMTLFIIVLLPVAAGMLLKARAPTLARSIERHVGRFGLLVLAGLIVVIAVQTSDRIVMLISQAGPSALVLILGGVSLGFLSGRVFGLPRADALTIAIEVGIKNGTIGLLVTLTLLQSPEMAIAPAVYSVLMLGFGAALSYYGHRRDRALSGKSSS